MTTEIKVLKPKRPFSASFGLLVQFRELLWVWTGREIKGRYRQSALGFGWALVQPVFQMVVISIIFGGFLKVSSGDVPYPVFAYAAILPWSFFSGSINSAVPSILQNMQLVTKIYFPREILPLSAIFSRLVDFTVASLVFIGLLWWYKIPLHSTIMYVPFLLLLQIVLAAGIGLLGAAVSVFLRDISFAIPLAMQLWMYASPVIYPIDQVPERWRWLYMLNPMASIIDSYRQVILNGQPPDFGYLSIAIVIAVILFVAAYWYFKRLEMAMSDII